jgi:CRP-like cAMP-binding protein
MRRAKKATSEILKNVDSYIMSLLERTSTGKLVRIFARGEKVFSQGDAADAIFFVHAGKVKISVVSPGGREAVLSMLGPPSFFGEGALVGQSLRLSTAVALEKSTVIRVEKAAMVRALHDQAELSEKFMAALLVRNIELEEDLCDQLFINSEKRLARVLLKLARLRDRDRLGDAKIPMLSHETLAEMVGTTRSRITLFMNKFRALGMIDYNGELHVRTELLTDVLLRD